MTNAGKEVSGHEYLADGVYVQDAYGMVKLYTTDGYVEISVIWLEDETIEMLIRWIRKQKRIHLPSSLFDETD